MEEIIKEIIKEIEKEIEKITEKLGENGNAYGSGAIYGLEKATKIIKKGVINNG